MTVPLSQETPEVMEGDSMTEQEELTDIEMEVRYTCTKRSCACSIIMLWS